MSGIDIALWDIKGKATDLPIYELLGGAFRDNVTAYATGCYYRGDDVYDLARAIPSLKQEARSYRDRGFGILKTKIGLLSVEDDLDRLRAIRDAIGADTRLLVDCNHAYSAATAIRIGRGMESLDIGWIEEPVVPEDRDGYRRVRSMLDIPVAGGECEYTRHGFGDLLAGGCVDIAQPDLGVCGGISEFQKILTVASVHGVTVVPHVWGSGVALAAALQVLAAMPNTPHTANPVALQNAPVIEFDCNPNPLRDELVEEEFALEAGCIRIPQDPGLGIHVREDILKKYQAATLA